MDGLFTPNFESDADKVAPKLAQHISVAAGVYVWLHSRVFSCNNQVGISVSQLSHYLGVDRRTVQRAIGRLQKYGLLEHTSYWGNGGGSLFRLSLVCAETYLSHSECTSSDDNAALKASNVSHKELANMLNTPHYVRHDNRPTYNKDNNKVYNKDPQRQGSYD